MNTVLDSDSVVAASPSGAQQHWVSFYNTDPHSRAQTQAAWEMLPPVEQERALRFHFPHDRDRWVTGRAWARKQLADRLDCAPQSLMLTPAPGGRLFLPDYPNLDFNLSHTGNWIALGMCAAGRIGIDLEKVDPAFPAIEIAAEFFLPAERDWVAAGPVERFFQLWTVKEALMKATGRGLSLAPDRIQVSVQDDLPARVTNLEDDTCWPVQCWQGPGGTVAAMVWLPPSTLHSAAGKAAN